MFSEISLHVVSVKKSFYGSALFLCRCHSVAKQPLFLSVDSSDYKWVETLKVGVISYLSSSFFVCFQPGHKIYFTHMTRFQICGLLDCVLLCGAGDDG